ncbi:MAG: winged helix-turn-helix domain-containing protein [Terracidiphilus sp.]|nr:winged helix-turn-helix domain-containing protein [Terracidiphilus sp.]
MASNGMVEAPERKVQFGIFEADLKAGELRRSGVRVRLQSQPFKLLTVLLEHPGEVVSRETLQKEIWGADTTVDFDHSLGIAVNKLREALGDAAENPRFVETLSRRGYRFLAPVKVIGPEAVADPVEAATEAVKAKLHWLWWVVAGLSTVCTVAVAAFWVREPERKPFHVAQITYSGHVLTNDLDVESFASSASDGTRLYFSHIDNGIPSFAVALVGNGEISRLRLPAQIAAPHIGGLSPDGSKLVLHSHLQNEPEQPLWIVPTLGGDARRVPNVLAHDATWMPDGQRLLVASGHDLMVVGTDGSDLRKFATAPGLAFWLRWSPDGKRLRFTLRDPKRQTAELWEARADGTHLRPLLPGWSLPASECCGSWTSDGEEFVFQSAHGGHNDIWELREHPWWKVSGTPRQITNGPLDFAAPTTAPGGKRVFFVGTSTQYQLLQAAPHATSFAPLDANLNAAVLAQFSHDGKWVAWLDAADSSLWRSRADGSERIELTTSALHIFTMRWSPDDQRLAVMAKEPGKPWKIYLIDSDGGKPVPILNEDRNEADPAWTPDGKELFFGRPPDRMDNDQPKAIYLLDLETKKVTEVEGSTGLFSPRLSPDGRYLVAMPLDQHALLLLDRTTGKWSTLTRHNAGDPTWSHDSRWVYFQDFVEAGKPIYRVMAPAGKPEVVATMDKLHPIVATDYRLIGLAPGDLPIVTVRTPTANLYEVDLKDR